MNWDEVGRFLVIAGVVLVVLGALFLISDKIPLGKLPGDIQIGTSKFKIYIPIATSVLLSIVLTLILNFFRK
jgi:hypothetical protein